MNSAYSFMTLPTPCGLAISSVTSDNNYLYALQPDRNSVFRLDACGRIICVFKVARRYTGITYCGDGKFYAVTSTVGIVYILNSCFAETGSFALDLQSNARRSCASCASCDSGGMAIGSSGMCSTGGCILTIASNSNAYAVSPLGAVLSTLGTSSPTLCHTAIAENGGILYEGLESASSENTFVKATLLSSGQTKLQRLPFGYKVRSFFCYQGRTYAFVTKNSFHSYVFAVCTFIYEGMLGGEIIDVPDDGASSCREQSCFNGCGCETACACGVTSQQTELCDNAVLGDSTQNDCDISELCRIISCIKSLCKGYEDNSFCGGAANGQCCNGETMNCTCYPQCDCTESGGQSIGCLPLPICPCIPCEPTNAARGDCKKEPPKKEQEA